MSNKKANIKLSPTLRISQTAKLLGVSTMTLRRWDKKGILKAMKLGSQNERRYRKEDILELLKNGMNTKG